MFELEHNLHVTLIHQALIQSHLPFNSCLFETQARESSNELADATSGLNSLFGELGELLGLNNARNGGEATRSENLEEALKAREMLLFNKERLTHLTTSITTAFSAVEALRASSGTRVHSLFKLRVGLYC